MCVCKIDHVTSFFFRWSQPKLAAIAALAQIAAQIFIPGHVISLPPSIELNHQQPSFNYHNFISTMPWKCKCTAKQKNLSMSQLSSWHDPINPFVKRILQPPLDPKYKPLPWDESKMLMTTTFGPFNKDKVINTAYMCHYYFPDYLINEWTKCTNAYTKDNYTKSKIREVKPHHILQFSAIYYYMGVIVHLPARRDWRKWGVGQPNQLWPWWAGTFWLFILLFLLFLFWRRRWK